MPVMTPVIATTLSVATSSLLPLAGCQDFVPSSEFYSSYN
jgi:hypothetical protein